MHAKRLSAAIPIVWLVLAASVRGAEAESLDRLQDAFERYSGARLVFDASDLPPGHYHDIMPSLSQDGRVRAARIALREVKKLPPGYLGKVGLKAVGVFAACASESDDGFHPYDKNLKGYRYYGIWNGKDGIAAAYYTDEQLPLTLHHEFFHRVDATNRGETDLGGFGDGDEVFRKIAAGEVVYAAPKVSAEDLAALKSRSGGSVLETVVSEYCKKSPAEDKAETARYLMSALPDALVQVVTRPELPGSQRMLHVLAKYDRAAPENGPGIGWFVDIALARQAPTAVARADTPAEEPASAHALLARLRPLAEPREDGDPGDDARRLLGEVEGLSAKDVSADDAAQLVATAAAVTEQMHRRRLQPRDDDRAFSVWGAEDKDGGNATLRADVAAFGADARRLKRIAALAPDHADAEAAAELQDLRLLARYYVFIDSRWSVTAGTRHAFEAARSDLLDGLPADQSDSLGKLEWKDLARTISSDGRFAPAAEAHRPTYDNPYLKKVDAAIDDAKVRDAIRAVQPACVETGGASGVCLSADGYVLTCGHVAEKLGARMGVVFPDGRKYTGACVAFDDRLDLAVVKVTTHDVLPFAPLAHDAPAVGTHVVCIGQPSDTSPEGKPTGYQPFTVSTGKIRGFVGDPLGDQTPLGRTKHDAWTYWGHSGSPLFNEQGQIVALHSSWDSQTAMRHAVTYQAIIHFLDRENIPHTVGE